MDGGNNANIRPNHRLYYLETILTYSKKNRLCFREIFGFKLDEDVTGIPALTTRIKRPSKLIMLHL